MEPPVRKGFRDAAPRFSHWSAIVLSYSAVLFVECKQTSHSAPDAVATDQERSDGAPTLARRGSIERALPTAATRDVLRLAGISPLDRRDPGHQLEGHAFVGFGLSTPMKFVRFWTTDGGIQGELYIWWLTVDFPARVLKAFGHDERSDEQPSGRGTAALQRKWGCESSRRGALVEICGPQRPSGIDWAGDLARLDALIVDGPTKQPSGVSDGDAVFVEVRRGNVYRSFYQYAATRGSESPTGRAALIAAVIEGIYRRWRR